MARALVNGRVLAGGCVVEGLAVIIDGARIAAVAPAADLPAALAREDMRGALVAPGFIDTQVNGGGGVLFNESPTVEAIRTIGAAHARFGTTGFLPTLISDDLSVIRAGIAAVDAAIEAGVPGVLGIHIEGPFINTERKGIHAAERIRTLDDEGFAALTGLRRGRTLVTVAPERTTPAMIRRLADAGVIVSAGHTDGSHAEVAAAIDAGLTGITHLFNAMSPLTSRDAGAVGAALESDRVWCALIVDGLHVSPVTMRLALRCKPRDRFMLVTDAMKSTGGDGDDFMLQGRRIFARDGRLVDGNGTLAGSNLDMMTAVRNAVAMLEIPVEAAVAMASANPAAFLGLADSLGDIAPGRAASIVAFDGDWRVTHAWADGVPLNQA